jgi:uncharacterized protein YeeX (DUF496 family)
MKRGIGLTAFILIVSILFFQFSLSFASVYSGNNSLVLTKAKYSPYEPLQGRINISLSNEPGDTNLVYNSNSISLITLLENSSLLPGMDFTCSTEFCQNTYKKTELSKAEKTISSGLIGMLLMGDIVEANTAPFFSILGNINTQTCSYQSPLTIDILDDGIIDYKYLKAGNFCEEMRGGACYASNYDPAYEQDVLIDSIGFCQRINPPLSSRFMIYVNKTRKSVDASRTGGLNMSMYYLSNDGMTTKVSFCTPNEPELTPGMIGCSVNFTVSGEPGGEYYICLKDEKQEIIGNYYVKRQKKEPQCGYSHIPPLPSENLSGSGNYPVFYKAASIAPLTQEEKINESEIVKFRGDVYLVQEINDYLFSIYNQNCGIDSSNPDDDDYPRCILPIKINATSPITLSKFSIGYYDEGSTVTQDGYMNIFSLEKTPPKVSTEGFKIVDIGNANLQVPSAYGFYNVSLFINNLNLGQKPIEVVDIPTISGVSPLEVFAGVETIFIGYTSSTRKIIKYIWDFGDGKTEQTINNSVIHIYPSIGEFNLTLKIIDNKSIENTRVFLINSTSPKDRIITIINDTNNRLENLGRNISALFPWQRDYIKTQINFEEIATAVEEINTAYENAETDEEYIDVIENLNSLDIPLAVILRNVASNYPVIPQKENINIQKFSAIGLGEYNEEQSDFVTDQILAWELSKTDTAVSNKLILLKEKDSSEEELATIINLKISGSWEGYSYVYLPYSEIYSNERLEKINGSSDYFVELDGVNRELSFMLPGAVSVEDFVFSISPAFEDLGIIAEICNANGICEEEIGENYKNCRYDCKPYGPGFTWLGILIVFAVIAFILIRYYYNNRYESHLFKNRHDLDNLKIYIINSSAKGNKEKDIKDKLKKAGWNSEQVDYAFLSLEKQKKKLQEKPAKKPATQSHPKPQPAQSAGINFKRPFRRI